MLEVGNCYASAGEKLKESLGTCKKQSMQVQKSKLANSYGAADQTHYWGAVY